MLIEHQNMEKIESFVVSKNFLAVFQRLNGLQKVVVKELRKEARNLPTTEEIGLELNFDEPTYELFPGFFL